MSGHGFKSPYILAQAHFHWGQDIRHGGSEHTINGRHVPMEMHLVHYSANYPSFSNAAAATGQFDKTFVGIKAKQSLDKT